MNFLEVSDQDRSPEFPDEPKDHEHEIRAYVRDPDDHLIEVGQSKFGERR